MGTMGLAKDQALMGAVQVHFMVTGSAMKARGRVGETVALVSSLCTLPCFLHEPIMCTNTKHIIVLFAQIMQLV